MPFLSPNQQRQSTEGKEIVNNQLNEKYKKNQYNTVYEKVKQ